MFAGVIVSASEQCDHQKWNGVEYGVTSWCECSLNGLTARDHFISLAGCVCSGPQTALSAHVLHLVFYFISLRMNIIKGQVAG